MVSRLLSDQEPLQEDEVFPSPHSHCHSQTGLPSQNPPRRPSEHGNIEVYPVSIIAIDSTEAQQRLLALGKGRTSDADVAAFAGLSTRREVKGW